MKLNNRTKKWTASLGIITTSALTASMVSAQVPSTHLNNPETRPLSQMDKAGRDISQAREESFSVDSLADQVSSQEAKDVTVTAQQVLKEAESSYKAGHYSKAEKQAKAAKALYEAAEVLYEAQLGEPSGSKALNQNYYETPYKAQESIYRAQVARDYYQVKNDRVALLISQAQELVGHTSSDFAQLAKNQAAEHLAKAAIYLIEAGRSNGL